MTKLARAAKIVNQHGLRTFSRYSVDYLHQSITDLLLFMDEEAKNGVGSDLSYRKKMYLWRKGFISNSYFLFQLDKNDTDDYVSQWGARKAWKVNRRSSSAVRNKLLFHQLLSGSRWSDFLPNLIGTIEEGKIRDVNNREFFLSNPADLIESKGKVVVKPIFGSQGSDINILSSVDGEYQHNGLYKTQAEVAELIGQFDSHIITEFIDQASYSETIYPGSTNTIRILTMIDPKSGNPFIANAIHRFGSDSTGPVDNWSAGGVCSNVDIESGKLSKIAIYSGQQLQKSAEHPDTGEQIEGIEVNNWESIKSTLLELSSFLDYVPYLGWDVVVTDDGFKILEANAKPGIHLVQLFGGLREDDRVDRFFDYHV